MKFLFVGWVLSTDHVVTLCSGEHLGAMWGSSILWSTNSLETLDFNKDNKHINT